MLYPIELNVPLNITGAEVTAGATTVDVANDFYYKVNGNVF